MRRRLISVAVFSLLAALIASTVLYRILSDRSAHAADEPTTSIYVAARDLGAGEMIGEQDIKLVKWPGLVSSQWVVRRGDLIGRGLMAAVNSGEPLPDNRLAPKGAGAGFAAKIPPGMRVMPVHIDDQSVLSHLIFPGMHVDVLSTGSPAGQNGPNVTTRTILQNIKVLSSEENRERNEKEKPATLQSVNLIVTPAQAEVLTQAISQTRIQLVMRNPLDTAIAELIPKQTPPVVAPKRPVHVVAAVERVEPAVVKRASPPTVEVVHGSKRVVTEVAPVSSREVNP